MKIKFASIGKIPIKETFQDFKSWSKWKINRWFPHHITAAFIGSIFITWLLNDLPTWQAIVLGSIMGWFISRTFEFYQRSKITNVNPKYKFTQEQKTESAKDWIATTIFFIIFTVMLNLIYR